MVYLFRVIVWSYRLIVRVGVVEKVNTRGWELYRGLENLAWSITYKVQILVSYLHKQSIRDSWLFVTLLQIASANGRYWCVRFYILFWSYGYNNWLKTYALLWDFYMKYRRQQVVTKKDLCFLLTYSTALIIQNWFFLIFIQRNNIWRMNTFTF